jgi:peroxiredoxin
MKFLARTLATAAFTATAVWLPLQAAHAAPPSAADAAPVQVENFTLTDETGKTHTLHDLLEAPAIVIVPQVNGDPVSRETIAAVEGLKAIFGKATFFVLNSSPADTPASIAAEAKALNATIPFLDDDKQSVARNLGVTQTGEAFIINPIGWKIVYRGPVSEAASADPTADYLLLKALTHVLGHRVVEDAEVEVKGTPIKVSAGG